MKHLIDKDAVVAEIKRRGESNAKERYFGREVEDNYFLDFLNTLEVKEVDLDKEVDRIIEKNDWDCNEIDFYEFAKHFFELGFKAQKGE